MKIILGSKSAGRQDVLKKAGFTFEVVTADIDEKANRSKNPNDLVLTLAHAKAKAILPKIKESSILITADQVVVCNGVIFEKPKDEEEARKFIHAYRKYPMETISSVVVTNTETKMTAEGIDISKVYFKEIPEEVINLGIKIGRIMHCAGAMRCEDKPFCDYVERFEGTKDSTSGLPLNLLMHLIEKVK